MRIATPQTTIATVAAVVTQASRDHIPVISRRSRVRKPTRPVATDDSIIAESATPLLCERHMSQINAGGSEQNSGMAIRNSDDRLRRAMASTSGLGLPNL